MRHRGLIVLALAAGLATPAVARDAGPETTLHVFIDSFNKGDVATATAQMADTVAITDDVPPFSWAGAGSFAAWGRDNEADAKARGVSAQRVTVGAATRTEVSGTHAYIVAPATYRFVQKGVKMVAISKITVAFEKVGTGWKINAWTWTGAKPTRAR